MPNCPNLIIILFIIIILIIIIIVIIIMIILTTPTNLHSRWLVSSSWLKLSAFVFQSETIW